MVSTMVPIKMYANYNLIVCILFSCLYWQGSMSQLDLTFASPASIDENSAAGTSVQAITASGGAPPYTYTLLTTSNEFEIDIADLKVKTGAKLDFENTTTYTLEIQVEDSAGTLESATGTLTVSITDVNEPPNFTGPFSACVNKAAPADTLVTTVTATDPDAGEELTYAITGGDNDYVFQLNTASGAISTAKSVPATPTSYTLTYTATDDDGTPAPATAMVTVTVGDPCPAVLNNGNGNNGNNLNGNQPNHGNGNNGNNLNGNQNTNTTQNQNGNFATRSQCKIYVPLLGVAMVVLKSIL